MDVDVIKEGINSLIRAGYYKDKEKLLDEAFRTMLKFWNQIFAIL